MCKLFVQTLLTVFSNSVIQVLRHLKYFTKCLQKSEIKKALDFQRKMYPNEPTLGKKDNFRISILLSNVFTNIGLGIPNKALENIAEIRKHLANGFFSSTDQQDA
jgi:hypothetical protein